MAFVLNLWVHLSSSWSQNLYYSSLLAFPQLRQFGNKEKLAYSKEQCFFFLSESSFVGRSFFFEDLFACKVKERVERGETEGRKRHTQKGGREKYSLCFDSLPKCLQWLRAEPCQSQELGIHLGLSGRFSSCCFPWCISREMDWK